MDLLERDIFIDTGLGGVECWFQLSYNNIVMLIIEV